jgi:TnpA family transposase
LKKHWSIEELIEYFTFLPNEFLQLGNKTGETRLGFAVLFKFFQYDAKFPNHKNEIPKEIIVYIAKQIKIDPTLFDNYNWEGRSIKYHRLQIRKFFNFREVNDIDIEKMTDWLSKQAFYNELNLESLKEEAYRKFRKQRIEPPKPDRFDRMLRSSLFTSENQFFQNTFNKLSEKTITKIDNLIGELIKLDELNYSDINKNINKESLSFNDLRSDPGRIGIESVFCEIMKLKTIQILELPENLFSDISLKILKIYKQRVLSEDITELRRHPNHVRYTLLAVFFWIRYREITDNLVELLMQIIHRISVRAEKKVDKELIKDFRKVSGKNNILFNMAKAVLDNPDDTVRNVVFPIVNENILKSLIKEFKNTGTNYKKKVYTVMRSSYANHYRRIVPEILDILQFRSNNEIHQPVIKALKIIKKYCAIGSYYIPDTETIPIEGVIKPGMKDTIIDKDDKEQERINRINYEIVVLQSLRDKLRCKEIWVIGAERYRNPDEDLPKDFEKRREENYKALKQPLKSEEFIDNIRRTMYDSLEKLDNNISKNDKVKFTEKNNRSWISITPFDPQPEPANILKVKKEILNYWPMTNLLDVLKEADLRINFTDKFKTMATHERLERSIIQKRLILALYGLGTNAGLKRISASKHGESYANLLYIRKKFINKDNLRNAISTVVNAILSSRIQDIWGEGTTTCASDAKKFGAWDQNLMTEWHIRYRGRGVMIYWHVGKKSTCIYSQLKTCSSSEVSAMIDGLLKHCTNMEIEKNYVDTNGQSEVAFAFCHLLGFKLMPRLKNIGRQKLYRPDTGIHDMYANLQQILTRPINWGLIRQQYNQMIKYATALRLGTAETEAIMKRFTRNNLKHPTYLALTELGKAIKTIFLCKYIDSEKLRIEINKGLNVVENWNSANSFIFYGKSGEICTNRIEDQEIAVLSLHLLQNCLVYVNTLMIQRILTQNEWINIMTPEDFRALTPLIYVHINPYGDFDLDMNKRIPIDFL